MKRPILIVAAIVVALIAIRVVMSINGPSDEQLVRNALADSIKASKEGRPGGVIDYLSDKMTINGMDVGVDKRQILAYIKNSKPDITVSQPDPVILGDEARITSPVNVKMTGPMGMGDINQNIDNVILVFAKEDSMQWLIFPTKKWRLKEVKLPDDVVNRMNP